MKLVTNFFNELASDIDKTYFVNVKYYRDNTECTNVHYAIELFNNGCLTYKLLVSKLAKNCKDTKENLHKIVSKYVVDFEGYEYK